jgi:hypothetical protein
LTVGGPVRQIVRKPIRPRAMSSLQARTETARTPGSWTMCKTQDY